MKVIRTILFFCFFAICFGSMFFTSSAFVNMETAPKCYAALFGGVVFALAYIISSFFARNTTEDTNRMFFCLCSVIAVICTAQALYGILQYTGILPARNGFRVTGSFDNPAGFAASLCVGFPFLFVFVFDKKAWIKGLAIAAGFIIIAAVVLSASRAGIVSLFVVGMLVLFYKLRIKTSRKIIVFFAAFVITLSGLYFLKKDSADGRLLIWRCTWEMIKDKPLLGHGHGGFKANYMNYQAAYSEKYPDNKFLMLADNINRPFNEYLLLLANYGIVGFGLFLFFIWFLWKSYRRIQDKNRFVLVSVWCLLSIGAFALFSYPLRYPFTWVMGILSTVVIISGAGYKIKTPKALSVSLRIILVPLLIVFANATYTNMSAEIKWCETAHKSLQGQTEQMLPVYKTLYTKLHGNELFLYNYAAELNIAERYDESLHIAKECERLWADYDLQMLMADNCLQMQQYTVTEQYYRKASAMCPVKFMPLYCLAELYLTTNRYDEARILALKILDKEVKVSSPTVNKIKKEMQIIIDTQDYVNDSF